MPQETATVTSLPQAHAVIKEMKLKGLGWSSEVVGVVKTEKGFL